MLSPSGVSDSLRTPWIAARQAPLSMGFSRQEYWSGVPFPSPEDLPLPGVEPGSPAWAGGFFAAEPPGKPLKQHGYQALIKHLIPYAHESIESHSKAPGPGVTHAPKNHRLPGGLGLERKSQAGGPERKSWAHLGGRGSNGSSSPARSGGLGRGQRQSLCCLGWSRVRSELLSPLFLKG